MSSSDSLSSFFIMKGKTMKNLLGFSSFCLLLAVLLLSSSLQAAFKIDVHINGATNPTLTFGEAEARTRSPHPPFSGMFGVVDVCFAGPEDAAQWYDRLAEDIKETAEGNQWILIAKSNARLTFKLKESDTVPTDIKIVYYDPKNPDSGDIIEAPLGFGDGTNEPTLSVKTGGVYTITRSIDPAPASNPNVDENQFVQKDGVGEIEIVLKDKDNVPFTPKIVEISFVSALGIVAYADEDVTERIPPIDEKDVDWWVSVSFEGYESEYFWSTPYTILEVTLTPKDSTRGEDNDFSISMTPTRSSAKPVTTIIQFLDEQDDPKLTKTVDWMLQIFGTLDFDDDGKITTDDVMYLYNFVQNGCDPDTSADDIKDFTSANSNDSKRAIAVEILKSSIDELKFSGDNKITLDDVMFMYNFVQNGSDPDTSAEDITDFNSGLATAEKRETALQTLKEYAE
jgi:hypothetical protein